MSSNENDTTTPDVGDLALAELLDGMVLDGFEIGAPIGAGGMGTVFRATQTSIGRTVAVKVVREHSTSANRFLREAKVISQIDHPNVVQLIDFGHRADLGLMYYAMEHIDGISVDELTTRGRLHPNLVIELGLQIASALAEAHSRGVVHRDLKGSNILVSVRADGAVRARVLDFGIAHSFEDPAKLTQTGIVCGTPAYIAPEQARGEESPPSIDLYALGVNLYWMACGVAPFSANNALALLMKHVEEQPPSLRQWVDRSLVPRQLEALVGQLLQKQPEDRPRSAAEVRRRLASVRQDLGWEAVEIDPPSVEQLFGLTRQPLEDETDDVPPQWLTPGADRATQPLPADGAAASFEDQPTERFEISPGRGTGATADDQPDEESEADAEVAFPRSGGGWSAFNETPSVARDPSGQALVLDPVTGEYMSVGGDVSGPSAKSETSPQADPAAPGQPSAAAPPVAPPERPRGSAIPLDVDNPRGRVFSEEELVLDRPTDPPPTIEATDEDGESSSVEVVKYAGVAVAVFFLVLALAFLFSSKNEPVGQTEDTPTPDTATVEKAAPDPEREPPSGHSAPRTKEEREVIELFDDVPEDTPPRKIVIEEEGEP